MTTIPLESDLLQRIVQALLPVLNKNTLIFFTGGAAAAKADEWLKLVDRLLITEAKIVVSPAFGQLAPELFVQRLGARLLTEEAAMRRFIQTAHLGVVPVFTRNTLAKASLGIQDNLVTNGIAAVLMRGLPLIGVKDNYHPDNDHTRELGYQANPAYNAMLLNYEQQLGRLGATLVDSGEFTPVMERTLYPGVFDKTAQSPAAKPQTSRTVKNLVSQPVITWQELSDVAPGTTVTVKENAIVTPLAQEYIKKQGITLQPAG
ncbi:flavoprotein [Propionispora hippei]|uniref:Flavoprotein n=1 Tax=Propionispora hippei DSM 15287 TaxID=1123003 RepID=A0A1M6JFU2_9FIRM|nr:flavoprotein [Propionispora hippei]SHJ45578.1 Flavoprotein [Propionispora hippei DSM 15287]